MQSVRIFISSPGDVSEERERARQVIQGLRRRYAQHFALIPVLWEDMPLSLNASFQEGIDVVLSVDRGVDIAVFILWSRLGSALGPLVRRDDGRDYRSGTERELELMLKARDANGGERPRILAYARLDEATFEESLRGTTTSEKEELLRQKRLVEQFIQEAFHDPNTGANVRAYHNFHRPQTFGERLRVHLQEILDGMCEGLSATPIWDIDTQGAPFRGLEPFRFEHAEIFFGREDEVLEARARLADAARRGTAFLLIGGASGTGKSSLAAAGLLPEIVNHEIDDSVAGWIRVQCTPAILAGDPVGGIARLLAASIPSIAGGGDAGDLSLALCRDPELAVKLVLAPALKRLSRSGKGAVRLAILVDQLEELFSDPRLTNASRTSFAAILHALASSGHAWIVATIRGDFYPRLLSCDPLVRLKSAGAQFDLLPPETDAVRRMIELPAALAGLKYEVAGNSSVADRILRDIASQAELLPLLEDFLRELFERRSGTGLLTHGAYEDLGGIAGALANRAEAAFASVPGDAQIAMPDVMLQLVSMVDSAQGAAVRRRAPMSSFPEGSPARRLIDRLVTDRLATTDSDDSGRPMVMIAHEAILRAWPRAVACIQANAEFLRVRDRLAARMREQAILTEADPIVPAARSILFSMQGSLEPDVRNYILRQIASMDEGTKQRARRRRLVSSILVSLSIAASLTAAVALWQGSRARAAKQVAEHLREESEVVRARALAESSDSKRRHYYAVVHHLCSTLAPPHLRLAEELLQDAEAAYHEACGNRSHASPDLRLLKPLLDESIASFNGMQWYTTISSDGTFLATPSEGNSVQIWNLVTGENTAVLIGHEDSVRCIAFSKDGSLVATGADDKTVRLWNPITGKTRAILTGHEDPIEKVIFDSAGSHLATVGGDGTVRVWDATKPEPCVVGIVRGLDSSVWQWALSKDGRRLATGGSWDSVTETPGSNVTVWDVETGKSFTLDAAADPDEELRTMAFSPDGTLFATAGGGHNASLWNALTGESVAVLEAPESITNCLAFNSDGTRLATGGYDGNVRVRNGTTGEPIAILKGHTGPVTCLAFNSDSALLATGAEDNTARIWDVATGRPVAVLVGHQLPLRSVAFNADGVIVATMDKGGTARLWDSSLRGPAVLRGHTAWCLNPNGRWPGRFNHTCVAISPDGTRIATGGDDNTVRMWESSTLEQLAVLRGHTEAVKSVAYSPDGRWLVSSEYGRVVVWDAVTGHSHAVLPGGSSFAFSPDSKRLATDHNAVGACIWDVYSGKPLTLIKGHDGQGFIRSIVFNHDGTLVATGGCDHAARVWDAETGELKKSLEAHTGEVFCVAFTADGSHIATGGYDNQVYLWDVSSGRQLSALRGGYLSQLCDLAFSPDGSRLVTAENDGVARLWDAMSGQQAAILRSRGEAVSVVAFSHDGSRLATVSYDTEIRLWDARTGEAVATLDGHGGVICSACFSKDGTRLLTGYFDGTCRVWGLTNADVHEHRKKAKLIRGLPLPRIDDCYAGGSAAAEARHDEVQAELTADQYREAVNLVTLAAEAKRKAEHDQARSRLAATVDSWFRDVPALTQELIENRLKAAIAEMTPEDFVVAWELCEEHAVRLRSQ